MRVAYGKTLLELAEKHPELVVLDADVSNSTQTVHFGKLYPERFFNVGVAETNMVDIAGGMATCGLKPFVNGFATFVALKAAEQIRNVICYNNLPVIIVGSYAGLSDSFDGASHQSIEDVAVMRALPNMTVISPADDAEVKAAVKAAFKHQGPVYLRMCRNPVPDVHNEIDLFDFEFGKSLVLNEGSDITIAASGVAVAMAIEAAGMLAKEGVMAEVINVSSIKPLDGRTILDSVAKTGKILTVEEHSVVGGTGSAVADLLKSVDKKMAMIGIDDQYTESGPYDQLLEKYGISAQNIFNKAKELTKAD